MHLATLSPGRSATERRVWARWAASVEMVGEKKARRQMCAARYRKKEARARDMTRDEIYLFSRAGSCPRESGAVSRRQPSKRNEGHAYVINPIHDTMKVEVRVSEATADG